MKFPWEAAWQRIQDWKAKGFAPEAQPPAQPAPIGQATRDFQESVYGTKAMGRQEEI